MSYQERGGRLINTGRALLTAAIIFSASGCRATGLELSPKAATATEAPTALLAPTRAPLVEGPLNPEVMRRMEQSLVIFTRSIKPHYDNSGFPSGSCNGFVIKDSQGKPLVVTPRHCFPESLKSEQDGKTYSAIGSSGENIFDARVKDITGREFEALPYNNYVSTDQAKVPDVMLFQVPDSKFDPPALALDLSAPVRWSTRYRASINDTTLSTRTYQFLEGSSDNTLTFFAVTNPDGACTKGQSGSPVVNSKGEVVATLIAGSTPEIDNRMINQLQLESDYKGKKVAFCYGVGSHAIQGLVRNP